MASPFTQAVVNSMRRLYPEALADKSFDNTGLLLEAPYNPDRRRSNLVLLTIDLTRAVADEAIENDHSVVVAYHPIIFRGLKSLTHADSQQATLLRLAAEGVSVYCPHTAVDAVPGGMADWLCDIVTGNLDAPEPETHTATTEEEAELPSPGSDTDVTTSGDTSTTSTKPSSEHGEHDDSDPFTSPVPKSKSNQSARKSSSTSQRTYSKPTYPSPRAVADTPLHPDSVPHTRTVIHPSAAASLEEANALTKDTTDNYTSANTGAGRLLTFTSPQSLKKLIERIARGVGTPKGFPVAIPQLTTVEDHDAIKTIAVCPGSGGGVLKGVDADLIFTGEMSHHEALAVTEKGGCVVCLFHSNSERGYLWSTMRDKLKGELVTEWDQLKRESEMEDDNGEVRVDVSERDRDPFGIVVLGGATIEGVKI